MAKTFNFNSLQRPVLEVTLPDENNTKIRVTTPTEEVVTKFIGVSRELPELMKKPDGAIIRELFSIYADVLSCNLEGMTFTAETLRDNYNLKLEDLILFNPVYLEFLDEIKNAKN